MCSGRDFDPTVNPWVAGALAPFTLGGSLAAYAYGENKRSKRVPNAAPGGPLSAALPDAADDTATIKADAERNHQLTMAGYRSTFLSGPRGPGGPSLAAQTDQLVPGREVAPIFTPPTTEEANRAKYAERLKRTGSTWAVP